MITYLMNQVYWLLGQQESQSGNTAAIPAAVNAPVYDTTPGFAAFKSAVFNASDTDNDVTGRPVALNDQGEAVPFHNATLAALANTSPAMHRLFQPVLDQRGLLALLRDVACGNKANVEAIIKANPRLLYLEGTTQDLAGRTLKGTALRIALGAKDVSIGQHEEMVEMIERYLRQQSDGEAEIANQKAAQFPEGWEQREEARKQADSAALKKVFAAIGASTTAEKGEAAVNEFKAYLAKQKEGIITTGYHFNEDIFTEASWLYEDHYEQFGGFDSPKNRLAAIKVIGGIEWYFTSCLASAACDGFYNVVEKKEQLSRSLKLNGLTNFPFYHPDLGLFHFVYSYQAPAYRSRRGSPRGVTFSWQAGPPFHNLCRAKTASLGIIMQRESNYLAAFGCLVQ